MVSGDSLSKCRDERGLAHYHADMSDLRTPLANKIIDADPSAYARLVVTGPTPALARELLEGVKADQVLSRAAEPWAGQAVLAGLWLWHDGLVESHRIAQQGEHLDDAEWSRTLNFWHAIMHRREGDFSNSKYWYARSGEHPVLSALANQAGQVVHQMPADKMLLRIVAPGWNAAALVDLVEAVHDRPSDPRHGAAVQLQRLEWRLLMEHCAR